MIVIRLCSDVSCGRFDRTDVLTRTPPRDISSPVSLFPGDVHSHRVTLCRGKTSASCHKRTCHLRLNTIQIKIQR